MNVDPGWPPSVQTVPLYDSPASPAINIRRCFTSQIIHASRFISPLLCFFATIRSHVDAGRSGVSFSANKWFLPNIISHPGVPFLVASDAFLFSLFFLLFLFLVIKKKKTSSDFPETQPTLISRSVLFFFSFFYPVTEKPSTKLKHTRGVVKMGVDDIVSVIRMRGLKTKVLVECCHVNKPSVAPLTIS